MRDFIAHRANHVCEYCQIPATFSTSSFSIEHIKPIAKGGENNIENLAYACQGCNNIKFTKTHAEDPESGAVVPLFNPRMHNWNNHFSWSPDLILMIGISSIGRATISALKINREEVKNLRALLFLIGEHPPKRS
jgi:5-methylcytosine-specific restriction endonuclease McrA